MDPSTTPPGPTERPLTMSTAMAGLSRYHGYLWAEVAPWLGGRVLEIGVGFGQYTRRMLGEGRRVLACDIEPGHLDALRASTPSSNLQTVRLDLEAPGPAQPLCAAFAPDAIVMLNVLEHIQTHEQALAFLNEIAAPSGRIILIVPALPRLYNGLDREAGHHRRYTRSSVRSVLASAGWQVEATRYLNLPGVAGWIVAGWLGKAGRAGTELNAPSTNWLLRTYDRFFVGLSGLTDPLFARACGLSVLAVAQKR